MGEHLTVGEVIDALQRYDPERQIITGGSPIKNVVSIEPGGCVLLVADSKVQVDSITCETSKTKTYGSIWGGMLGGGDDD